MNNFNMKAAVFTVIILLAFIGWISLSVAFPTVMIPINNITLMGTLSYMVFCIVKLYLISNKKDNQQ